jgi:hypothetical protein
LATEIVRLQVGGSPRLLNLVTTHPSRLGHRPKAPVRRLLRNALGGQAKNIRHLVRRESPRLAGPRLVLQTGQPSLPIPLAPLDDRILRHPKPASDLDGTQPLRAQQDDPRSLRVRLPRRRRAKPTSKLTAIVFRDLKHMCNLHRDCKSQSYTKVTTNNQTVH